MSNRRLLTGAERNRKRPAASASSSAQHPAHGAAELPEYEPPDCPLDETSRRALAALVNNSELGEYPRRLGESYELLKDSVRDINDHHVLRRGQLKNMQEKRRERDADAEPTEHERQLAEAVEALRDAVPELTKSCEAAVRAIIDWQVELADEEKALDEATTRLEEDFALYAEAVRENPDDEPPRPAGAHMLFAEAREALQAEYAATTMYQRYGQNNEYIHFKKLWHDAVHADDGKPLPEAARWFGRDGAPEDADDEDDDLIIAGEIQDFRCPLSMQVMTNPYTAPACKHTFEKAAIYEYLGPHPKRVVQCPQTGCEKVRSFFPFTSPPFRQMLTLVVDLFQEGSLLR